MLKVLIADDEKNICLMIRKLIPWEEKGMEVIGLAHNGLEAIEAMEQNKPDVIISDIRMPGYDGLELVRRAKEMNLEADFIIISGYKYFEYAHTALNLGVEHYLLKPIDKQELEEALDKILVKRRQSGSKAKEEARLKEQAEYSRRKVQEHFLTAIMHKNGVMPEMELNRINQEYQCEFEQGCFVAVFAKLDCEERGQELNGMLHLMEEIIDKDLKDSGKEYINSRMKSGVMTILNYRTEDSGNVRIGLEKPFLQMRRELDKFQGFHITMGVGGEKGSIGEISDSIQEAIQAIKCRCKAGLDRVIFYDQLHYKDLPVKELLDEKKSKEMENMVEALDYEALHGEIVAVSERLNGMAFCSPTALYAYLERVGEIIQSVLRRNQTEDALLQEMEYEIKQALDFYIALDEITYRFIEIIRVYFERVISDRKKRSQLPIRLARQYVQENFRNQVTLEEVAEAIGFSAAYLSTMFKKELGINFSDYLISCRMEEAKELLKQTDLSIAEVAERVGYTDSRYFSKTFGKVVGLKPSVYRKLYR